MQLSDILFYAYALMVLYLLTCIKERLVNWLWWYPPNLRGMRDFRLRHIVGGWFVWVGMVLPIIVAYERNRRSLPFSGEQRAASSGTNSAVF
jgi:hypothetical protein